MYSAITNRRSISLLIAIAGVIWSGPTHTPTTTTRENSGAPSMMLSITPGTPTHSNITGCLGLAPSASPSRHACHHPTGQALELLAGANGKLERGGHVGELAAPLHDGVGRLVGRVHHDIGAAGAREPSAPR